MPVQLTPDLEQRLEQLAVQTQRTPDELAHEAMLEFLSHREDLISSLREAEEQADREGWLTSEEVLTRLTRRFTAA